MARRGEGGDGRGDAGHVSPFNEPQAPAQTLVEHIERVAGEPSWQLLLAHVARPVEITLVEAVPVQRKPAQQRIKAILDFGLWTLDLPLAGNPKSKIQNPKSGKPGHRPAKTNVRHVNVSGRGAAEEGPPPAPVPGREHIEQRQGHGRSLE